jgi:hypothetical protein
MERESFESEAIAEYLNANFVSIKVDREERPDVDKIYMGYVQAVTGAGGWPLSLWLTPELKPFYGGTYFAPVDKFGRPGFLNLLHGVADAWKSRRADLVASADKAIQMMRDQGATEKPDDAAIGAEMLRKGAEWFESNFDERNGGFGGAPKFPRPSSLLFLLRLHRREGNERAKEIVEKTLEKMAAGGMYDQLGGGFHRYSVDARWHVPHFEKMLYDQGQLAVAYAEGYQVSGNEAFAETLRGICDYVLRDLKSPEGAFYSAEDADSLVAPARGIVPSAQAQSPPSSAPATEHPEKREGAFYVFAYGEIVAACGADAEAFCLRYGATESGNADDPHGELTGQNVLFVAMSEGEVAAKLGVPAAEARARIERARAKLLALRSTRPRPHLDDKILAGWNGLMISGLARASRALREPRYAEAAAAAARFVTSQMFDSPSGELRRRHRAGETALRAQCDDYAFFVQGLLDLYSATFDTQWLEWALRLAAKQDQLFSDPVGGGWFGSAEGDPSILLRFVDDYDGAEPAPSSVAALNALRLAELTGDPTQQQRGEAGVRAFARQLAQIPAAMPQMLATADFLLSSPEHVVIAADSVDAARPLTNSVARRFSPNATIILLDPPGRAWFGERLPWLRGMQQIGGQPAAYVCVNRACNLPVTTPEELGRLLDKSR